MPLTTNIIRGPRASRLMLLLHGYGADEKDLAPVASHLDPDGRFLTILPRGQYSAPPGAAWYQLSNNPSAMGAQMRTSLASVEEVFNKQLEDAVLTRDASIVAGFSQGGSMVLALTFGKEGRPRPAGVIVMSGFLPMDPTFEFDFESPVPPVLVQHGTSDELIPVEVARQTSAFLASNGVPVVHKEYEIGHGVTPESLADARAWLDEVRSGQRPSGPVPDVELPPEVEPEPQEDDDVLVRTATAANFDRLVLQSEGPVIVDFWAPWCEPCKAVSPIVEQIAAMRKGSYRVVKLDIDQAPQIAQQYQIQSIPLVALFRNGRLERRSTGAKPRPQLEAELGMIVIP